MPTPINTITARTVEFIPAFFKAPVTAPVIPAPAPLDPLEVAEVLAPELDSLLF